MRTTEESNLAPAIIRSVPDRVRSIGFTFQVGQTVVTEDDVDDAGTEGQENRRRMKETVGGMIDRRRGRIMLTRGSRHRSIKAS